MTPFESYIHWMHRYERDPHFVMSGSRVICDPPVLDTDIDYLVYVNNLESSGDVLMRHGWTNCFEEWAAKEDTDPGKQVNDYTIEIEDGARFQAWRNGEANVIVTDSKSFYVRSCAATLMAKSLNLRQKSQRIELFRAIKYGNDYNGPLPQQED